MPSHPATQLQRTSGQVEFTSPDPGSERPPLIRCEGQLRPLRVLRVTNRYDPREIAGTLTPLGAGQIFNIHFRAPSHDHLLASACLAMRATDSSCPRARVLRRSNARLYRKTSASR